MLFIYYTTNNEFQFYLNYTIYLYSEQWPTKPAVFYFGVIFDILLVYYVIVIAVISGMKHPALQISNVSAIYLYNF